MSPVLASSAPAQAPGDCSSCGLRAKYPQTGGAGVVAFTAAWIEGYFNVCSTGVVALSVCSSTCRLASGPPMLSAADCLTRSPSEFIVSLYWGSDVGAGGLGVL